MAHKSYKVSEDTRRRLLEAAGELFACHGTEAVTVRDITARAGTMPNAVSYHFGGKEGLIDAVWEFCLREWTEDRMGRYCAENEHLFKTRDGKRQMVTDLIGIFYETLCADDQPLWANLFLLRTLITAQDTKRTQIFNKLLFDPLSKVYRRITGNTDRMTARCWVMTIICPGSYLTASATDFLRFEQISKIDYAFCRRLKGLVTQSALTLAGLADTPKGGRTVRSAPLADTPNGVTDSPLGFACGRSNFNKNIETRKERQKHESHVY